MKEVIAAWFRVISVGEITKLIGSIPRCGKVIIKNHDGKQNINSISNKSNAPFQGRCSLKKEVIVW